MNNLGNKQTMAKNIKRYMEERGVNQSEICKILGLKTNTFSDWVNAKTYPRIDKIELMSNYFGISKADLVEEHTETQSHGVATPILGTVIAGTPIEAYEDILGYEEISIELANRGEHFCLRISGESMQPVLQEGDLVVIRMQSDVDSGDIAVVLVNGHEATVKQVQKSEHGITLIAYNPSVYSPKFYSNQDIESLPVQVVGKVVEMHRTFD